MRIVIGRRLVWTTRGRGVLERRGGCGDPWSAVLVIVNESSDKFSDVSPTPAGVLCGIVGDELRAETTDAARDAAMADAAVGSIWLSLPCLISKDISRRNREIHRGLQGAGNFRDYDQATDPTMGSVETLEPKRHKSRVAKTDNVAWPRVPRGPAVMPLAVIGTLGVVLVEVATT